MNKKLSGVIGIVLSILLLVYFNTYFYKLLSLLNININNYSTLVRNIIDLVVNIILCVLIYLLYRKDFKHKRKDNIFKTIIILLVSVIGLVLIMYLFSYVINYLGDIFNVSIKKNNFYNIFDKKLDIYLGIRIVKDYIIYPFIICSIILLSVDKIARRNDTYIILCGLLASVCNALTLSGNITYVIINSLNTFLIFVILSIMYRKSNNIWFSIILYGLYLMCNLLILKYIGW